MGVVETGKHVNESHVTGKDQREGLTTSGGQVENGKYRELKDST